jgi:hypothetical protein
MKKRLITGLLLFAVIKAEGQRLTASDMIEKACCKTYDCFNEQIIKKGFHLEKTRNDADNENYYYTSDYFNETNEYNHAMKYSDNIYVTVSTISKYTTINIHTPNKEYYLKLLEEFKDQKFRATETKQKNYDASLSSVITKYNSDKYPKLSLSTGTNMENYESVHRVDYYLSVWFWWDK